MKSRYVLAPEAALDLVQIWRYIGKHAGVAMADRDDAAAIRPRFYDRGNPMILTSSSQPCALQ